MTLSNRLWIALALFLLPILYNGAHYTGLPQSRPTPQIPPYGTFRAAQAPTASAPLEAPQVSHPGARVLIDFNHDNTFQLADIELFTRALAARGASVELYFVTDIDSRPLAERLKYASAFVLFSPYRVFDSAETAALRQFVAQGGRLLVFADAYRGLQGYSGEFPDTIASNLILAPYGLSFTGNYLYNLQENDANFRNVKFSAFEAAPLTEGLKQIVFYGARSVNLTDGQALIRGDENVLSSLNDQPGEYTVLGLDPSGNVAAIGSYTFMTPPFDQSADNARFIQNLAEFALSAQRTPDLSAYPYLFTRPVNILVAGEAQLTAENISALAGIQASLRAAGLSASLSQTPGSGDKIIIASFSQQDETLTPYFEQFDLTFEEGGDTVTIANLGDFGIAGNGFLFYLPGFRQNTLLILADTPEDQASLLQALSYGDLNFCMLQSSVAVCPVGFGGSFGSDTGGDAAAAGG